MSKKNRGGRPPGSKNIEYMPVVEVPPACTRCKLTEFETIGKAPIIKQLSGTRDGHEYNRIVWTDKRCTGCGQHVRVISYQKTIAAGNIPDKTSKQIA